MVYGVQSGTLEIGTYARIATPEGARLVRQGEELEHHQPETAAGDGTDSTKPASGELRTQPA